MCLIPESYIASYVGRFAPPGYPNTTSTPSAFRHSMTASTARMRYLLSCTGTDRGYLGVTRAGEDGLSPKVLRARPRRAPERLRGSGPRDGLGLDRDRREVQLVSAA